MLHPFLGDSLYADFFVSPKSGALFNFVIFCNFREHFVLFKFFSDFLFFFVTVFSLMWNTDLCHKFVLGLVVPLICRRVDSHQELGPALDGAEMVYFSLFTIVVLVLILHKC